VPPDLVPEVLLALGFILIPGAGACLATGVAAGRPFVTFLGLAFGLGVAVVALASLALALVGLLNPAGLAAAWLVIAASAWIDALRRGRVADHARAWRGHVRHDPWASLGAFATIVGVIVVRWTVDPLVNVAPTVLRYWADGLEIADAGRIPETTLQWGRVLPPASSKAALNAFDAAVASLLGRGPIAPLAVMLFVVAIGVTVATMAVFTELGIRRWAPVGVLVLFFTPLDLAADLEKNLAENWGRLVALSAIVAAVPAVWERRSMSDDLPSGSSDAVPVGRSVAIAGVLLGVAAATHLVAASVGLAFLCALAVAIAVMAHEGALRVTLSRTAAIIGVAVMVGGTILVLVPGDLGFQGAVSPEEYADLRADLSLPETFDPTLYMATNDIGSATAPPALGVADVARQFAYTVVGANAFQTAPGEGPPLWLVVGPTIGCLVLAMTVVLVGPPDLRVVALAGSILAAGLFGVGVLFAFRYDLFALEFFGNRRLFSYAAIAFVLIALAAAEAATRWLGRGRLGGRIVPALACVAVLTAGAILLPRAGDAISIRIREDQYRLVERIGEELPCEGRVLFDHRTLGTFQTIAGRAGVLEGMGPHVRPWVLRIALEEILLARDFFSDPSGGGAYLRERGVGAIVVSRRSPLYGFGGYRIARVRPDELDRVPFLRRWFENAEGIVYRVEGTETDPGLPRVTGRPGFPCAAGYT
jgi:hypothetical protein